MDACPELKTVCAALAVFPDGYDEYGVYGEWKAKLDAALRTCHVPPLGSVVDVTKWDLLADKLRAILRSDRQAKWLRSEEYEAIQQAAQYLIECGGVHAHAKPSVPSENAIAPTPMPVSRYTIKSNGEPIPTKDGEWVDHGDYEALERLYLGCANAKTGVYAESSARYLETNAAPHNLPANTGKGCHQEARLEAPQGDAAKLAVAAPCVQSADAVATGHEADVEWLRRFLNCAVFGPPPSEIQRAQNVVTDLLSALSTSRLCTKERDRRCQELEAELSARSSDAAIAATQSPGKSEIRLLADRLASELRRELAEEKRRHEATDARYMALCANYERQLSARSSDAVADDDGPLLEAQEVAERWNHCVEQCAKLADKYSALAHSDIMALKGKPSAAPAARGALKRYTMWVGAAGMLNPRVDPAGAYVLYSDVEKLLSAEGGMADALREIVNAHAWLAHVDAKYHDAINHDRSPEEIEIKEAELREGQERMRKALQAGVASLGTVSAIRFGDDALTAFGIRHDLDLNVGDLRALVSDARSLENAPDSSSQENT